jgi:hypothetical protein
MSAEMPLGQFQTFLNQLPAAFSLHAFLPEEAGFRSSIEADCWINTRASGGFDHYRFSDFVA